MDPKQLALAAAALVVLALFSPAPVSGQAVATSCTASLITSFTPCLGYITNSTNGGGSSPTADCCRCLAAIVNTSTSCACLILTGNVPLGLPINHTLAVTLPKACNSMSVPLQCKDTSAQLPAPGPVAVSPAMPPLPPMTPEVPAPTAEPTVTTPSSPTSCTASLITSFTPCLGYITNNTNGGGSSPTADCCRSLAAVVNTSTSCACLILTGNVPLGLPINHTLAAALPKACNSMSVPLQCKDTSAQLPAPGPVAVSPAMPPLPPMTPEVPAPTAEPTEVVPSSAWRSSAGVSVLFAVAGSMLV